MVRCQASLEPTARRKRFETSKIKFKKSFLNSTCHGCDRSIFNRFNRSHQKSQNNCCMKSRLRSTAMLDRVDCSHNKITYTRQRESSTKKAKQDLIDVVLLSIWHPSAADHSSPPSSTRSQLSLGNMIALFAVLPCKRHTQRSNSLTSQLFCRFFVTSIKSNERFFGLIVVME